MLFLIVPLVNAQASRLECDKTLRPVIAEPLPGS